MALKHGQAVLNRIHINLVKRPHSKPLSSKRRSIGSLIGLALIGAAMGCREEPPTALASATLSEVAQTNLAYPAFLIDAQTAERYRQEGLRYRQEGRLDVAIAALKIAAALDPLNPNSHVILGWTQHLAGDQPVAAQTLQRALQQEPDYVPALNALGIVQLVAGNLETAVSTHSRAAQLQPNNEIAHYNLSLAYERLGQFEEAITNAEIATQLEPQNPHPWVALALAHWSKGNQQQAQSLYQQVVKIDSRYRSSSQLPRLEQAGFSLEQIQATETLRQASL